MRAVRIEGITKAEDIRLTQVEIPAVQPGWVLVRISGFGLNHSEQILRQGEITRDYITKPVTPGIECVGEIVDASDTSFKVGQRVCALMGGMGRSFHGSYAEYALLPAHHVFAVETRLQGAAFAAVPETYYTAWGSLFSCLQLQAGDTLLVRGATCALGYAAIQLAHAAGAVVIATTHKEEKLPLLAQTKAEEAVLDDGQLAKRLKENDIRKVLELVGPATLLDSLRCTSSGGMVCNTGILGGKFTLPQFNPISDIPSGVYLTGFHSNSPTNQVMKDIFSFLDAHDLTPHIGAVYPFCDIREACIAQDEGRVNGKIVVMMEEA